MHTVFSTGPITPEQQQVISNGFAQHSAQNGAPRYYVERLNWLTFDEAGALCAALTADYLWNWLYIDELWVDEARRGKGLGAQLLKTAEREAKARDAKGLWLWTQSWQAAGFYKKLGFIEFCRFDDFPRGHTRYGMRKEW